MHNYGFDGDQKQALQVAVITLNKEIRRQKAVHADRDLFPEMDTDVAEQNIKALTEHRDILKAMLGQ